MWPRIVAALTENLNLKLLSFAFALVIYSLVHGGQDRVVPPGHSEWLLRHCPDAELWLRPGESHISILDAAPLAMDWLRAAH